MATYYDPADLANFSADGIGSAASDLWEKFIGYYGAVYQDGALTAREKSLMALSVAAALQCPYCIDAFTQTCLSRGCDADQIMEAFHVASSIRAGATMAHGVQALSVIEDNEL